VLKKEEWNSASLTVTSAAAGGIAGGGSSAGLGAGAAAGLDGERYNRQLHQYEINRAKMNAKKFKEWVKKEEGKDITEEEAEGRLMRQQLRFADSETAKEDQLREDKEAAAFLKENNIKVELKISDYFDPTINQDIRLLNIDSYAKGETQSGVGEYTPLNQNETRIYRNNRELLPSSDVVELYGYARIDQRPLGPLAEWFAKYFGRNPLDNRTNTELIHEQIFFKNKAYENEIKKNKAQRDDRGFFPQDESFSSLWGKPGVVRKDKDEYLGKYWKTEVYYDADRMKQAWNLNFVNPGDYHLIKWNCQDWMDKVRKTYDSIPSK